MIKLAPGVYDGGDGDMHIDMTELLAAHGFADSPANRATLIAVLRDVSAGAAIIMVTDAPIRHGEDPDA